MPKAGQSLAATYYSLIKPGIVYGNAITAAAGFLLTQRQSFDLALFIAMLSGISLVIASACVFNNYIDKDIDRLMPRTKSRALADNTISSLHALSFASLLALSGFAVLIFFTNLLAVAAAFIGFFTYIVLYGIGKRQSIYGTEIGSISGAMPIVVGYVSGSGQVDSAALLLFLAMVLWQMPHFFAIALYRSKDYAAAKLPVLPLVKGVRNTQYRMLAYLVAYTLAVPLLTFFGHTGYVYAAIMSVLNAYWLWIMWAGLKTKDTRLWARHMFKFSLVVLLAFSVLIAVDVANRNLAGV